MPGKVTVLFGRNGTGKSTLLEIASGQLKADSGITIIDDDRIYKKALAKRFSKISYLPQYSMLPNDITVKRIVNSVPFPSKLKEISIIKKMLNQKVEELSTGEKRFLEITLLFSLDSKYILLDEPFTGIEPIIIEKILNFIKIEKKKNKGILLTDHYHQYTLQLADTAYLMHQKQCYKLRNNFQSILKKIGYL